MGNYHHSRGGGDNYHHSRRGGDNHHYSCGGGDNYYHNCGSGDYYHHNCGGDYYHDYYNDHGSLIEHSTELKQIFAYKAGSKDFQLFCTTSTSFSCKRISLTEPYMYR